MRIKRRPIAIHQRRPQFRLGQTAIICPIVSPKSSLSTRTSTTYYPYPPRQTTSTAPRDHSHPSAARASAAAYSAAQSAVCHDTLAAAVHVRNSQEAGCPRHISDLACHCRSCCACPGARPGMRRAAGGFRSWSGAARSPGDSPGAGWGGRSGLRGAVRAAVCCTRGAQRRCVVGAGRTRGWKTSFARPGGSQDFEFSFGQICSTHLLRFGVHRQPVRVEALVVCHGGVGVVRMRAAAEKRARADIDV
jgi:hypothetical protein